jgi:hypothetical protein
MRSLFAIWLIALLSLSNLSAADRSGYACQPEVAFCATEEPLRRPTAQEQAPITLEEYWNLVRDTRQAVSQMEAQPEATIRRELEALAAQWEQVRAVEYSDESIMQVEASYLAAELRREPPELERLGDLLEALLLAHEQYPQGVFILEDIAPLQTILARPEFQWQQATPWQMPDWLTRIQQWIEQFRNRVLGATFQYGRVPLIVAALILFLISVFFISRGLSRSLVREAQLAAEDGSDELLTSKGAFKRAETLSLQGDYRNAIRYLYLSSLLVLDEQGVMRYDRARTNREYLRSVSSKPELAKPLREVIDVFDRVWYGFEGVDEQAYQTYVERVDELREKKE